VQRCLEGGSTEFKFHFFCAEICCPLYWSTCGESRYLDVDFQGWIGQS
jgi:hypothetical protein